MTIATVVRRMQDLGERLTDGDARRHFHAVYLRTTEAVADEVRDGGFVDPAWVEHWDEVFAELYLDALEVALNRGEPPRPWAIAFAAAAEQPGLPPLRHVLLGMNAHINYDLPQALVAVITAEQFDDPELVRRREQDHVHIDTVLLQRVGSEDAELATLGPRSRLDRMLAPLNRAGTKRFLSESRRKVWHNAVELDRARRIGPAAYDARLRELEKLSTERLAKLTAPGQVLLRLAAHGFGVRLSPAGTTPAPGS